MDRVQKLLANAGIASRRKCEDIISAGRVKVNGKVITLGDKASESDKISVDGELVKFEKKVYLMLNKPKGYVCTVSEDHHMKTVMRLIKSDERVYPVGRLDKNTTGLIIFTNDGDFANQIMHPKFELEKTYVAVLDKNFVDKDKFDKDVVIDDMKIKVKVIRVNNNNVSIKIHEGRKHIVKRIFEKLGYDVVDLSRTSIGSLKLGRLPLGSSRDITSDDLLDLRSMLKLV